MQVKHAAILAQCARTMTPRKVNSTEVKGKSQGSVYFKTINKGICVIFFYRLRCLLYKVHYIVKICCLLLLSSCHIIIIKVKVQSADSQ